MTTLASIDDYKAITGLTVADGDESDRITRLLELASDAVLAGVDGQNIASATYEDEIIRPYEGVGYFTQRPVSAVTSVKLDGQELAEGTDYRWTTGGNGRRAKLIRRFGGIDGYWATYLGFPGYIGTTGVITASYTAGFDPVPGQIVAIVVAMTRAAVDHGGAPAPIDEVTGPFTTKLDVAEVQSPSFALTASAQAVLDGLCGVRGPTSAHILPGS